MYANADMLLRLPHEQPLGEHSINALKIQIDSLPITAQQIHDETINDKSFN